MLNTHTGDHTKDFSAQGAYGYRVFQPAVGAKEEDDCEMRPSGPQSASSGNGDLPQGTNTELLCTTTLTCGHMFCMPSF